MPRRKKSAPTVRAHQPATTTSPSQPPSPSPSKPSAAEVECEVRDQEVHIHIDTRHYRVRGLEKNLSTHQLRVNILAHRDDLVHMDTLDLCKAKSRASFIQATAAELFVEEATVKRDLGRLLLKLEDLQREQIEAALRTETAPVELTLKQRQAAIQYLRSPQLTQRILDDYARCGLVGEETNKLVCYLACVSRLLPKPLALLIQSGSAAGKTSLMDATLHFMPVEAFTRYSAMTGQSLYYMGQRSLRHKILAVAEEEGIAQASYALKLLQSDGRLTIAAAGRNGNTGRQQTEQYSVEGPVMMFLTTTAEQPDAELQNRCVTLHVNESPEQTAAIQSHQRTAFTLDGQTQADARDTIRKQHHDIHRVLEPLPVVIPYAGQLQFRHDQTRMRRDHDKYMTLIAASAVLHQYQRPRKSRQVAGQTVEYIEATLEDVALANRLASEVMGHSLTELLPQTRHLLLRIDQCVGQWAERQAKPRSMIRFTQRQLREELGWGDFQLRRHLARLVELEYILAYRTGARNQREYQLLYDGEGRQGERFLLGLAELEQLAETQVA